MPTIRAKQGDEKNKKMNQNSKLAANGPIDLKTLTWENGWAT